MKNFLLLAFAALTLATSCKKSEDTPASTTMQLSGDLNSSNIVLAAAGDPAIQSSGKGSVTGTFDKSTMVLTYSITYSGLTGPATLGHFHIGAPGTNGPAAISFTNVSTSPITGTATLTQAQADALLAGNMYANIHTRTYTPVGEIRAVVVAK